MQNNQSAALRFGSVASGIEAASVAFNPLGWKAAWFSEIEAFPSKVLAHHFPNVPNLGDMTTLPARYKALGNSWPVPMIRWVGARIDEAVRQRSEFA